MYSLTEAAKAVGNKVFANTEQSCILLVLIEGASFNVKESVVFCLNQ